MANMATLERRRFRRLPSSILHGLLAQTTVFTSTEFRALATAYIQVGKSRNAGWMRRKIWVDMWKSFEPDYPELERVFSRRISKRSITDRLLNLFRRAGGTGI